MCTEEEFVETLIRLVEDNKLFTFRERILRTVFPHVDKTAEPGLLHNFGNHYWDKTVYEQLFQALCKVGNAVGGTYQKLIPWDSVALLFEEFFLVCSAASFEDENRKISFRFVTAELSRGRNWPLKGIFSQWSRTLVLTSTVKIEHERPKLTSEDMHVYHFAIEKDWSLLNGIVWQRGIVSGSLQPTALVEVSVCTICTFHVLTV